MEIDITPETFYKEWDRYILKMSVTHDVVCLVPLVGYFSIRHGEIVKCEISYKMNNGDRRMGSFTKPTKDEIRALDTAVEKAMCNLVAIPYSGLSGEHEFYITEGNGHNGWLTYYA